MTKKIIKNTINPAHSGVSDWRWRMAKAGLRQEDLADKAGVAQTSLSRWMNGHHNPPVKAAKKIESVLKRLKV